MIESVTPHLHDDRTANASGGSLLDRTIVQDGTGLACFTARAPSRRSSAAN